MVYGYLVDVIMLYVIKCDNMWLEINSSVSPFFRYFFNLVYYDIGYYSIDFIIDIICDHVMVTLSY